MRIKYFKNWDCMGDVYVPEKDGGKSFDYMNMISFSKENITIFANDTDERFEDMRITGFYRDGKIEKNLWKKLTESASAKSRESGLEIIKKIHKTNLYIDNGFYKEQGDFDGYNKPKMREVYEKAKPILE